MGRVVACRGYMTQHLLSMQKHLFIYFFLRPTYLGLALFTDVSCQIAATSLIPNAFLFLRLYPLPHLQVSREMTYNSLYTPLWREEKQRFISGCYLFCYVYRILDYNLQGTDKLYSTNLLLYIIFHQLIWITGSLHCVRLSSKKAELPRFVSQRSFLVAA
jgi:hypothetical protein